MTKDEQIAFLMDRLQKAETELDRYREAERCQREVWRTSKRRSRGQSWRMSTEGETIEGDNVPTPGDVTPKDVYPPHISPPNITETVRRTSSGHRESYSEDFESFWVAYPPRNGLRVEKREAGEKFKRWVLTGETETVVKAAKNYAAYCEASQRLPMDAHRWLRDGDWREWVDPIAKNGNGNGHTPREPEIQYGPQGEKFIDGVLVMSEVPL